MPKLWWSAARQKLDGTQLFYDELIQFATRMKAEGKWKLTARDFHI